MLDVQRGGKKTNIQQKVYIWKLLHRCITLTNLYQNPHAYYPILVPVLQIMHCKLNLSIKYPPPYGRLVWNYKNSNSESIRKYLELVN